MTSISQSQQGQPVNQPPSPVKCQSQSSSGLEPQQPPSRKGALQLRRSPGPRPRPSFTCSDCTQASDLRAPLAAPITRQHCRCQSPRLEQPPLEPRSSPATPPLQESGTWKRVAARPRPCLFEPLSADPWQALRTGYHTDAPPPPEGATSWRNGSALPGATHAPRHSPTHAPTHARARHV